MEDTTENVNVTYGARASCVLLQGDVERGEPLGKELPTLACAFSDLDLIHDTMILRTSEYPFLIIFCGLILKGNLRVETALLIEIQPAARSFCIHS